MDASEIKFDLSTNHGALVPIEEWRRRKFTILIIDRSRSMIRFGGAPLRMVNGVVENLRADKKHFHVVAVFLFSDTMDVLIPPSRISDVPHVHQYENLPGTREWETVDRVLGGALSAWTNLPPIERAAMDVTVGVFSDGEDVRSPRPKYPEAVQRTSSLCLEAGWTLVPYAFGIDGKQMADDLGFPFLEESTFRNPDERSFHRASQHFSEESTRRRR